MMMMMMMLIMLINEVQEVIGPPAVSVTTADVFATIQAKVIYFYFPVQFVMIIIFMNDIEHLLYHH